MHLMMGLCCVTLRRKKMTPLIDCDILRYEIGSCGQYEDDDGNIVAKNFDSVASAVDQKIAEICALVWATEEPVCFLSMDARTKKRHARKLERKIKRIEEGLGDAAQSEGSVDGAAEEEIKTLKKAQVYRPNFREAVAKKKAYKECRKGTVKPLHYDNITEYILANYECIMAEGLEADDLLSIHQREAEPLTTIICSRDKDLRMVPGMHFGWECGRQSQFGPENVSILGRLKPIYRGQTAKGEPKMAELKGTGMLFFGAQLLVGDSVDSIPGLPGCGPKKAFLALEGVKGVDEMFIAVKELYVTKFGDNWEEELLEQGRLLWMLEGLHEDGSPIMWEIPEVINGKE
jgi:hypothetical protein